ncbi:MAG: hypothetical protein DWQ08_14610 [Proteobacteria bacterium]|nr:MAG: hypothetical protein DWQ08_14610 [Pseudomonadota bacterium]
MKSLLPRIDPGAESGEDIHVSTAALESRLTALRERRRDIAAEISEKRNIDLALDEASLLVDLERPAEAYEIARQSFQSAVNEKSWDQAVLASDILYNCGLDDALVALGHGVWLSVTFPVDPELTLTMLNHIVEETPNDSDGAAVAAATAAYVVDLRVEGKKHQDLSFFAMQLLGTVARRHGDVDCQDDFDAWTERLELTDPDKFLVRLRNIVDVLVQDDWWLDRDHLRDELPMH